MFKIIIFIVLVFGCFSQGFAKDFETSIKIGWGKRFIDGFDRTWSKLRYESSEIGQSETITQLSFIRNVIDFQFNFLISPIYKHNFGLSMAVFKNLGSASLSSTIGSTSHVSSLDFLILSPGLAYQYYPFLEKQSAFKYFYIAGDIGVVLANMTLYHQQSGSTSFTEELKFRNLIGARIQIKTGTKIHWFHKLFWVFETGLDITRLDDLEASSERQGSNTSFTLKNENGELIPVDDSDTSTVFSGFEKSTLWIIQFQLNFGVSYMF